MVYSEIRLEFLNSDSIIDSCNKAHLKCAITYQTHLAEKYNVSIVNLSDDSFEEDVLKSSTPVLVDYWAEWCGPCKSVAPILEELASEYDGKVTIAKLNIDDNAGTPPKYGIRGIPTLMLFKDGEVVDTKVGALNKSQLTAFLDQNI